jgi:hypothetical protein
MTISMDCQTDIAGQWGLKTVSAVIAGATLVTPAMTDSRA